MLILYLILIHSSIKKTNKFFNFIIKVEEFVCFFLFKRANLCLELPVVLHLIVQFLKKVIGYLTSRYDP